MKALHGSAGFTLIEMIVSLGVFSIVVTTAIGAMFVVLSTNQQLQSEQSVMTNLGFALDGMTREIRTGFNYYCTSAAGYSSGASSLPLLGPNIFNTSVNQDSVIGESTSDCPSGRAGANLQGVSFFEGGMSITGTANRILYFYDAAEKTIKRRVGSGQPQNIVSSGLSIEDMQFYVTGSNTIRDGLGNSDQPTVTIYIEAKESATSTTAKTYKLQTTVTQRTLDL